MAKARKSVKKAPAKAKKKATAKKKTAKTTKAAPKRSAKAKVTKQVKTPAKKAKAAPKAKAPKAKAPKAKAPKAANGLNVGDVAPAFSLPTDGGALDLASFVGKKNVVLYFYPKDDTPGCTVQACTFEKDNTDYASADAVVVGVSADTAASHAKFRQKYNLNFPLVVDEGAKLANKYGVWVEKNNYGKKYMGIQRTTFLIGKDGKIAKVWPRVKVDGHSADVLSALRSL